LEDTSEQPLKALASGAYPEIFGGGGVGIFFGGTGVFSILLLRKP